MTIEDRGRTAGLRTVATFESSTNVALDFDRLLDRRRSQRRNRTVALAASVVVAVFAVFVVQSNLSVNSDPQPMEPVPGIDVGDVPVWYDDAGLHRGDVVEQTPVEIRQADKPWVDGALALVRTGALYLDPATGDVWLHPWGGDPRIVGHNSSEGPGGDPNGDTAAWFEGTDLVVYDTANGRELLRLAQSHAVSDCNFLCAEHFQGNRFLQVSGERIVWAGQGSGDKMYNLDLRTPKTVQVSDVDEQNPGSTFVFGVPIGADETYADVEVARPSSSGSHVLGIEFGGGSVAVILDTKTGDRWQIPDSEDPYVAWSYGDIALVDTEDELRACDAALRSCETLPAEPPLLMPTN